MISKEIIKFEKKKKTRLESKDNEEQEIKTRNGKPQNPKECNGGGGEEGGGGVEKRKRKRKI